MPARATVKGTIIVNKAAKSNTAANRQRRLSAALRENLKRRKAQARARAGDRPCPDAKPAHDSAGISTEGKEEEA